MSNAIIKSAARKTKRAAQLMTLATFADRNAIKALARKANRLAKHASATPSRPGF